MFVFSSPANPARDAQSDARLRKSFRKPQQNGWIYVHLEGSPSEIGFQHGYLLASEIEDAEKVIALGLTHDSKKDWAFFRNAAETMLWPHVQPEYQEELKGIAEDLRKMQVHTSVAEGDVGRLQQGMDATFTVDAFPGQTFKGKVGQIRNAATTVQNSV